MISKIYSLSIFLLIFISGCKVNYTFTGINVNAETITINTFYNDAEGGPPDLGQKFTDMMREYFQQNTNLVMVDEGGDLLFEGAVSGFRLSPVSPQAGRNTDDLNTAAETRLTITVSASYTNINDPTYDFDRSFPFYGDFPNDAQLIDIEEQLIEDIYDQIILNIFNASVANW